MSENNIELKNNPEVNNINNNEISQMNKSDQIEYSEDEKKQIETVCNYDFCASLHRSTLSESSNQKQFIV